MQDLKPNPDILDKGISFTSEVSKVMYAGILEGLPSPDTLILYSSGNYASEVAVIAQSPGKDEMHTKSALTGFTGRDARKLLAEAGFDLNNLYFTNIYKTRALNVVTQKDDWSAAHKDWFAEISFPAFLRELRDMPNLRLLITLGEIPFNLLTGKKSITKHRGSVYPLLPSINEAINPDTYKTKLIKVCPSLQPAILQHSYQMRYVIKADFDRAREELSHPDTLSHPSYNILYPTKAEEIVDRLDTWKKAGKPCSVDTETYRPLRLSCLSVAPNPLDILSIEIERPDGSSPWSIPDTAKIMRALDSFLQVTPTIMQNAMYDLFVFKWLGYTCPAENLVMDTMLAHHCLWPELPHGLDFLCSIYTDQPYYKDEGKLVGHTVKMEHWDEYLEYNAKDSGATYKCALELSDELYQNDLWSFYQERYLHLLPVLLSASLRGFPVSLKRRRQLFTVYNQIKDQISKVLSDLVGHPLNCNSSKQVHQYLFEELKIPPQISQKTGRPTADETTLRRIATKYPFPQLRLIFQTRKIIKHLSPQYVGMIYDKHDLCVRTQFNLMGTNTGRLSGTSSPTGSGGTMQNLPRAGLELKFPYELKEKLSIPHDLIKNEEPDLNAPGGGVFTVDLPDMKSQYVMPYPYVLLIPDYKQAETYIVAHLAEEKALIELLFSGADIHKTVAARYIYEKDISEVSKDERYLAKRTGHAANYGMGPLRFIDVLAKDDVFLQAAETKMLLLRYHTGFPNIRAVFHAYVEREIRHTRRLVNCVGRPKFFLGRLDGETFRSAYSFLPQSGVSDILNQALKVTARTLPVLGQQHDSMQVVSTLSNMEKDMQTLYANMKIDVCVKSYVFNIPNDMKYGPSLGTLKELDLNSDGTLPKGTKIDYDWIEKTRRELQD